MRRTRVPRPVAIVVPLGLLTLLAILLTGANEPDRSVEMVSSSSRSVEGDGSAVALVSYPTAQEAIIAEALRLHPELTSIRVRVILRLQFPGVLDLRACVTAPGFSRMYGAGGRTYEGELRWHASESPGRCEAP